MKSVFGDIVQGLNEVANGTYQGPKPKHTGKPVVFNLDVAIPKNRLDHFLEFVFTYLDFAEYLSWAELHVVARHKQRGLLISDDWFDDEASQEAVKAWRQGKKLPTGYYAITKDVAIQTYLEGVKWGGWDWEDRRECDGNTYHECLQRVLFGKVKIS